MNLTTTNIDNRLMLARCCYADIAINYLQKKNIGDNEQASCYLSKMKQLYYSMEALNDFTPSDELSPSWSITLNSLPSSFTGTREVFVDGNAISDVVSFTSASRPQQGIAMSASVNLFQNDYTVTVDSSTFTVYSVLSGTTNNGLEVSFSTDGAAPVVIGVLAGGAEQWCLDDERAKKIIENIDELCGCPCEDCDDILNDDLPNYIN